MPVNQSVGTRVWMSSATVADTIDTEVEYSAQLYTELSLIESIGEFGRMFETATFVELSTGRTIKLKGAYNDGSLDLSMATDLSDAGQLALHDASDDLVQSLYAFKIELKDNPTYIDGPTAYFFRALPMSYRSTAGGAGQAIKSVAKLELVSDLIYVPPYELLDNCIFGQSTGHINRYKGSSTAALYVYNSSNELTGTTGTAGTNFTADGNIVVGVNSYTPSAGQLIFECRLNNSTNANCYFFCGFTDQTASLEAPAEASGVSDGITTNASNAVGFMFDTNMATDNVWAVGVKADVDATSQNTALNPTGGVYRVFRVVVETNGSATFWINGAQVGSTMANATTAATPLYPVIAGSTRNASSRIIKVSRWFVRQN